MELLILLGIAAGVVAGSAVLAVRYGYRRSDRQMKTLGRKLRRGKPGWKIWI